MNYLYKYLCIKIIMMKMISRSSLTPFWGQGTHKNIYEMSLLTDKVAERQNKKSQE
jgi:hypothetical protein